jgi:dimeric dUTPase (all-alpha-NTP-PPase superfamily)
MDRLEHIFQLQAKFDQALIEKRNLQHIKPDEWIQKEVLAIVSELGELLDETNFKWWKNPKDINHDALREELVDILHFFISMCIRFIPGVSQEK